jgi:hypothetical protein
MSKLNSSTYKTDNYKLKFIYSNKLFIESTVYFVRSCTEAMYEVEQFEEFNATCILLCGLL